jgi:hypothetical protein
MSDNEPDGIENATHNLFAKLTWKHKTYLAVSFWKFWNKRHSLG